MPPAANVCLIDLPLSFMLPRLPHHLERPSPAKLITMQMQLNSSFWSVTDLQPLRMETSFMMLLC